MSEAAVCEAVLTREELDALLESLGGPSGGKHAWYSSGRRGSSAAASAQALPPVLERGLEDFAREESRSLSNLFQTTIRISPIGCREIGSVEFAEVLLPNDRFAYFDIEGTRAQGFFLIGRPLFFHLMCLNLGARRGIKRFPIPTRSFTRIESRLYLRLARDFLGQLDKAWSVAVPVKSTIRGLEGRRFVLEGEDEKRVLASFDVRGFGEVCRIRVAMPDEIFEPLRKTFRESGGVGRSVVEDSVMRMTVELQAELGSLNLPLSELARLRVGTVLPLDSIQRGKLVLRVGGRKKFHAIRGSVGRRAAVQLTDLI